MGRDKALLKIGGETLLERAAKTALEVPARVFVVGRAAPPDWPLYKVAFLPDDVPGRGPLGALQTILRRESEVLALACDMPNIDTEVLHWLLSQPTGEQGTIVSNDAQLEPLFSVYRATCLPLIEANLSAGRRSLHALIEQGDFYVASAPPEIAMRLINVNTPADWDDLRTT